VNDAERCYLAALRILGYRFNSALELRRKLQRKKFDVAAIDATIARLREEKWLDDARFAGAFVRTRAAKRIGAKRIALELRAAGIDDEVAARAVAENVDPAKEREQLEAAYARRAGVLARRYGPEYVASEQGRTKLVAYLLMHGYEPALVYDVCSKRGPGGD
jgi:SOS response regulatory protein OraA/RecX